MRQTPVNDYLEEISTELPEELYGNLSDAIYETVCEFDEGVAQLRAENARLREQVDAAHMSRLLTENENESLRELCAGLLTGYECGYGELCKGCTWDGLGDSKTFSCLPRAKARELGVEVDA